jgi:hypothetical protein
MMGHTKIWPSDVENLEWVGRSSGATLTDEAGAARLLIVGFVQKLDPSIAGNAALVITDTGRRYLTEHRKK